MIMLQNMDKNNFLRVALNHLLLAGLGKQIGFPTEPIDYLNQVVFDRLLLLLRSGMTMRLIRNLVCSRADPLPQRTFERGRRMVFNPFFSLKPPESSFSLLMRVEGYHSFPILKIQVIDCPGTQVVLQLSTMSKHADNIGSKRGRDLVDQVLLNLDMKTSTILSEKTIRVSPESFSMSAKRGKYHAYGDITRGNLRVVYDERLRRDIGSAHSSSITAFAFHRYLRVLATCDIYDLKLWYIPSGLANTPVLITRIHIPPGRMVFSLAFHPKYPVIFIGRIGSLEILNLM